MSNSNDEDIVIDDSIFDEILEDIEREFPKKLKELEEQS